MCKPGSASRIDMPNEAPDLRRKVKFAEDQVEVWELKANEAKKKSDELELEVRDAYAEMKYRKVPKLELIQEIAALQDQYRNAVLYLGQPAAAQIEQELEDEKKRYEEEEAQRVKKELKERGWVRNPAKSFEKSYEERGYAAAWMKRTAQRMCNKATSNAVQELDSLHSAVQRERNQKDEAQQRCDELKCEIENLQRQQAEMIELLNRLEEAPPPSKAEVKASMTKEDMKPINDMIIHRDEILDLTTTATEDYGKLKSNMFMKSFEAKQLKAEHHSKMSSVSLQVKKVDEQIYTIIAQLKGFLEGVRTWEECDVTSKLTLVRDSLRDLLNHIKEFRELEA
eukprot:gnl/MRDRNA2_/MRDRNA2_59337_c0_seq2.p1 gnl/MRDRNA2_/MRDRNA2_59337_c0~~gnl/MRDRNA2_/MRDRNA2_59337_c0_seq2.p1  ORF type:complete len:340 (+),score=107.76 gnl/MRDRNA2_/MRDRNA2_59337_c0_seq2:81-1100(+)